MAIYLKKGIEAVTGQTNECWRSIRGNIDIVEEVGVISLIGFKDGQAFADGKISGDNRIVVLDLSKFPSWHNLYNDIAVYLASKDPTFIGATIETVPNPTGYVPPDPDPITDPTPDPIPDPIP